MNLPNSGDFCLNCGNIVDLPIYSDLIECLFCNHKTKAIDYQQNTTITRKDYQNDIKPWLDQYQKMLKLQKGEVVVEKQKLKKAIINQECPKCRHNEMYFYTLQLRSADEGSTVFYECVKCAYKYSQNN